MKFDIHELKQSAGSALERAGRPAKRLVLIFAAVNMALSILTASLSGYLAHCINDAVGLAGASTRAGLAVLQILLSWITLLGLCVLTVWFVLRYRLTTYLVCDNPNLPGSWMPGESARIMKGKMWQFLRVDLSLWWYYLLIFLASAFLYATTLLELARVQVSLSPMAMDALTVVGYGLVSFILEVLFLNRVQLTYIAAYKALPQEGNQEPQLPGC